MTASPSTRTGTAPGGEISAIFARLAKRWGLRMSTTTSTKGMSASLRASQARKAQLDAFRVPEYRVRVTIRPARLTNVRDFPRPATAAKYHDRPVCACSISHDKGKSWVTLLPSGSTGKEPVAVAIKAFQRREDRWNSHRDAGPAHERRSTAADRFQTRTWNAANQEPRRGAGVP